jgi:ATP-dependent helicase YprA (DUF1998 family)
VAVTVCSHGFTCTFVRAWYTQCLVLTFILATPSPTSPDMLHQSILPVHQSFSALLSKLAYVVVDEGHAYRGVFGSHTALVLRRLRRLCLRAYSCTPTFVVTSATIANPQQHAQVRHGEG